MHADCSPLGPPQRLKAYLLPHALSTVHSIRLADVDHDGFPEIIALSGGSDGAITMWKRQ
jgi:hypothetical protein